MTNLKSPKTGPGSQMGQKSRAVLEVLRKNGRMNCLDIEMKLGVAQLARTIHNMYGLGYIKTPVGIPGMYEITNAGREALGEALALKTPTYAPHCTATMKAPYIPAVHNTSRIGVARS